MRILGTGSALPRHVVTNNALGAFLDTSDAWITSHTGIKTRRVLTDETLTDLVASACRSALDAAGLEPDKIDYLIVSTLQGDAITPSLACMVQGAVGTRCPAYDVNAACTGFIYGLDLAEALIASGKARHILLVGAEALSRVVDWTDRSTCVLFGDGAGAVVLGPGEGVMKTHLTALSSDMLYAPVWPGNSPFLIHEPFTALRMAGQDVYKFAVSSAMRDVQGILEAVGLGPGDVDLYFLHQANMRITEAIRRRLNQPAEKFATSIEKNGNTSSASIPIMLDEAARSGVLRAGQTLLLSAFGAGPTTGACLMRWNPA